MIQFKDVHAQLAPSWIQLPGHANVKYKYIHNHFQHRRVTSVLFFTNNPMAHVFQISANRVITRTPL
jgi:hypothetical protein